MSDDLICLNSEIEPSIDNIQVNYYFIQSPSQDPLKWFYQENPNQKEVIWKEYDIETSELLEINYQDFLSNKEDP